MLATPPFGASSNIALLRANSKPPVELVVANLDKTIGIQLISLKSIIRKFTGDQL
jgi:hypothetical protein